MRILIAFDGSECSEAAIEDLSNAGLPEAADVAVLSVAQRSSPSAYLTMPGWDGTCDSLARDRAAHEYDLCEARVLAGQAGEWLRSAFPKWHIESEAWVDAAGPAIVRKARTWRADLIVVGSHGRSGMSRIVLGSISRYVLHHADCSVRVSRRHLRAKDRPPRLLIAVDGSSGAKTTGQWIAARHWPAGAQVRVVGVVASRASIDAFPTGVVPVNPRECKVCTSVAVGEVAGLLEKAGLQTTADVLEGKPAEVLLTEVEKHAVDCVFVGTRGLNAVKRLLLGSVSDAVASHANCSVEIVRELRPASPSDRLDVSASIGSDSSVDQRQHGTGAVLAGNGTA